MRLPARPSATPRRHPLVAAAAAARRPVSPRSAQPPCPPASTFVTIYAWVSLSALIITALLGGMHLVLRLCCKPFKGLDAEQRVATTFHSSYVLLYAGCLVPMTYYGRWAGAAGGRAGVAAPRAGGRVGPRGGSQRVCPACAAGGTHCRARCC